MSVCYNPLIFPPIQFFGFQEKASIYQKHNVDTKTIKLRIFISIFSGNNASITEAKVIAQPLTTNEFLPYDLCKLVLSQFLF